RRSGGSISVQTEVGKGSSFTMYFPSAGAAEMFAEPRRPAVRSRARRSERVLLVEDAPGLRELARRLLQRQGYQVLLAADALEALRLFEQNSSIDVLLTDVVMPGASGPELTRRLVAQRPGLKVIYMSGHTEEAVIQHGV